MLTNSFWTPINLSLEVAIISFLFVLVAGTILAKVIGTLSFKGKAVLESFFMIPIVLPPTVIGFLLVMIFGNSSFLSPLIETILGEPIIFSFQAAVLASFIVAFPLMYQSAKVGFQSVDPQVEEAARVDGASATKVFLQVTLPLSWKSLISGGILSFARALGEFGATYMFAGNIPGKTQTVPIAIYSAMESGNMQMAWLWVIAMIFISFLMLAATNLVKN
ncbi:MULTISPECIES: molybdate ABC transporter permease subunit [unclassified Bacillus (in: firmicutes)]|uniref:molybdate ABC transporter permease subunit n=1 Tax=unclassified Bacillus (in: firmicutes) TaxID=185979 RepID=UPI0008F1494A|nr:MULTISPECIES: molybdate ABC transporter permease subunit [unclassified Bacillus (in: firmicutes)]SFA91347.1 molybdate transport system permease protein [Bacillus sp. UNCCL13]SFQ85558.1 molybdate transport system permease protein [Bacillus sp. cl95]